MKALTTTISLLYLFILFGCKKDDLPKASQTGKNIMAAKVDGKIWTKKACVSCFGGGDGLKIEYSDRDFFVIQGVDPDQDLLISIVIKSLKAAGTYALTDKSSNYANVTKRNGLIEYYTSQKNQGQVTITKLDLAQKIISGTFEFTVANENNSADTKNISSGRFDVKFD